MNTYTNNFEQREIRVQCDCGDWLKADTELDRVSCDCGKGSAVTVTDMYHGSRLRWSQTIESVVL